MKLFCSSQHRISYHHYLSAVHNSAGAFARASWPQWRGPSGQGISEEKNLPARGSATKNNQMENTNRRRGHSSPIIWGNKIFVTTALEGPIVPARRPSSTWMVTKSLSIPTASELITNILFKVLCLHRETGKILLGADCVRGTPYDDRHRKSSYAASTPATDGKHVYAFFGSEVSMLTT